jgi:hypothetical protein
VAVPPALIAGDSFRLRRPRLPRRQPAAVAAGAAGRRRTPRSTPGRPVGGAAAKIAGAAAGRALPERLGELVRSVSESRSTVRRSTKLCRPRRPVDELQHRATAALALKLETDYEVARRRQRRDGCRRGGHGFDELEFEFADDRLHLDDAELTETERWTGRSARAC